MDRFAVLIGSHLIKNIRKLQFKFIFGHKPDMRGADDIWMGQQRVIGPSDWFFIKNIQRGMPRFTCIKRSQHRALLNQPRP